MLHQYTLCGLYQCSAWLWIIRMANSCLSVTTKAVAASVRRCLLSPDQCVAWKIFSGQQLNVWWHGKARKMSHWRRWLWRMQCLNCKFDGPKSNYVLGHPSAPLQRDKPVNVHPQENRQKSKLVMKPLCIYNSVRFTPHPQQSTWVLKQK